MKIYDKTGTELADIAVTDESYRFREIMGKSTLTLYFSLVSFMEFPLQSYVDFQGERFYLFDPAVFEKKVLPNLIIRS